MISTLRHIFHCLLQRHVFYETGEVRKMLRQTDPNTRACERLGVIKVEACTRCNCKRMTFTPDDGGADKQWLEF